MVIIQGQKSLGHYLVFLVRMDFLTRGENDIKSAL